MKLGIKNRKNLELLLKKNNFDSDTIDLESEWDSSLSYEENKTLLIEKFGLITVEDMINKDKQADFEQKEVIMEQEHYTKEQEEQIEKIKEETVDLKKYYGVLPDLISMINQGFTHSVWIVGGTGTGKTTQVNALLKGKVARISGHITPYKMVEKLYEYRREHTLFFDDTESLLENTVCISILKQALETNDKRFISWDSKNSNLPNNFALESKIIFCVNSLPDDIGMRAILGRSHKVELFFDYFTFLKIMYIIAKKPLIVNNVELVPKDRKMIVDFIKKKSSPATKDFNLRTQSKIEQYFAFNREKWEELAIELLEVDKEKQLILELSKDSNFPKVSEQQTEWSRQIGRSRRTYYRLKEELKLVPKCRVFRNDI